MKKLEHITPQGIDLGLIGYTKAWELQKEAQELAEEDPKVSRIFFLEHSPVVTFGKNANVSHLIVDKVSLEKEGVDVIESDRGGQVTAHMPGQLVVYPIINLGKAGVGPKDYVCNLEGAVIDTLAELGIAAARDSINPGVWVGMNKICAVGIRISRRVCMHGIALNISNDFGLFRKMTPCGISGRGVTSVEVELKKKIDLDFVKATFAEKLGLRLFGKKIEVLRK